MSLDITRLNQVHVERNKNQSLVYETIYLGCQRKILYVNNHLYKKECVYDVPSYKFGLPLFNQKACTVYIMMKLRKYKFYAVYKYPNQIHIKWDKTYDNEITTKIPIDFKPYPIQTFMIKV